MSKFVLIFLSFWAFGQQHYKNETGKKIKNLFGVNLIKYSSEFLAHVKKDLCHIGSPTNVQNSCIKLYGFGVDITRLS